MDARRLREAVLLATTIIGFISGAVLVGIGMYVIQNMGHLVENNLDPAVKGSNLTRTLIARYGAIVPDKDYIPMKVNTGPWLTWIPARVFDMGVAVMAFSAFGMYIVTSGKPLQLYVFIVLLLAAVVGQLIFMVNMLDYRSKLHQRLKQSLTAYLQTRYEFGAEAHDPFTFIMNGIMLMGECCGINGHQDFLFNTHSFIHMGGNHVTHNATVIFPLACCQRGFIEKGFYKTLDCALSWSKQAINKGGCYQKVYVYLSDQFGSAIIWTYVAITYVELLQVLLCLSLASHLRKEKNIQPFRAVYRNLIKSRDKRQQQQQPTETDI